MPTLNRRGTLASLLTGLAAAVASRAAARQASAPLADPTEVLPLWPGDAPGGAKVTAAETLVDRTVAGGLRDRAVSHIRKPTLTVFRPAKPNGAAVMLAPGGSYERVVMDKEGFEMARWLSDRGYTAFVLLYRLPGDGWASGPDVALQDAQRAVRLIRARAGAMGFDPARVAIMGFSAGGHVAASLTTRFDAKVYDRIDAADDLSARPDLSALIYPVITMRPDKVHMGSRNQLLGANPTEAAIAAYSPESGVTAAVPPVFQLHAADDKTVPVENSLLMFAALRAQAIPTELHVFEEGGHGFGLRGVVGKPVAAWPALFETFAKRHGV
ncbi:MAG: hypothetical protein JWP92_1623 [Caulobacter sp.]|nr:hypothetical protein [Caulobacter sp.]